MGGDFEFQSHYGRMKCTSYWVNVQFRAFLKIIEMDRNEWLLEFITEGKAMREFYCGRTWRLASKSGIAHG